MSTDSRPAAATLLQFPLTKRQPNPPPEPGIHRDMPDEEYFKIAAVSQSFLKLVQKWAGCDRNKPRTPAHAMAYLNGLIDFESDSLKFGAAYHTLLFEPMEWESRYVTFPKERRGTKKWASMEAEADGREIVFTCDHERMMCMRSRLLQHPKAGRVVRMQGQTETAIVWHQPVTMAEGETILIPCKAKLDHFVESVIVDIKSARNAGQEVFGRAAATYGYHIQAWFYLAGLEAMTGAMRRFLFIAQESAPPFEAACYTPEPEEINAGSVAGMAALRTVARCVREGVWPGYDERILSLGMPSYALVSGSEDGNGEGSNDN